MDCSSAVGSWMSSLRNLLDDFRPVYEENSLRSSAVTCLGGTSTQITSLSEKDISQPQSEERFLTSLRPTRIRVMTVVMMAMTMMAMTNETITFLELHLLVHRSQQPGQALVLEQQDCVSTLVVVGVTDSSSIGFDMVS
mmetsp:Transcript_16233/g.21241  ORF Transcript_16233/g.21241 Transcript_16233/m.21241 type:complete len:139 (-) Transcript_16233:149-565(-)